MEDTGNRAEMALDVGADRLDVCFALRGLKSFWRLCTMIGLPPGLTSSKALLMSCSWMKPQTGEPCIPGAAVRSLSLMKGRGRNRPPLSLRQAQPWRVRSFSSTPSRVSRSV